MNFIRNALIIIGLLLATSADAASRFWVGGTGTWDGSSTTHWASSSGGSSGASVPGSSDTVTLDGSSGGGTVTVNTTVNVISITTGAFTGTLDFSANNNNVTVNTLSDSGSGTRTFNMGTGTWTFNGLTGTLFDHTTITGLTFSGSSAPLIFTPTTNATGQRVFVTNSLTYGALTITGTATGSPVFTMTTTGNPTFASLSVTGPLWLVTTLSTTVTISSAFTIVGTSSAQILFTNSSSANTNKTTWSVASGTPSFAWSAFNSMAFTGGATFTATNSFDFKNNSGITITAPSTGGGFIIGGG